MSLTRYQVGFWRALYSAFLKELIKPLRLIFEEPEPSTPPTPTSDNSGGCNTNAAGTAGIIAAVIIAVRRRIVIEGNADY
jgi:hypothetical protein